MKPNSVAPSTPAMEAAREIHEHEVKRRSKSAVVIHVDCEAKILAIAAILDRHFPSREPQAKFCEVHALDPGDSCPCCEAVHADDERKKSLGELREMREALQFITNCKHPSACGMCTSRARMALEAVVRAERVPEGGE